MKTITARFGLLFIVFLLPAPSVLGAASADHKVTCEQVGDLALKVMYKRQEAERLDSPEPSVSWEDKILTAGISLRATQVLISSDPDEKLESIVKFGEFIYSECKTGKLGLLQQYVGGEIATKNNTPDSVEMLITELLGRLSILEREYESISGFRQETNAKLNTIRTQINALAYGD
jgi:hypothetical protein